MEETRLIWACSCGETFPTDNKMAFVGHIAHSNHKKGKHAIHESRGKINPDTGEVVIPPERKRDHGKKKASSKNKGNGKKPATELAYIEDDIEPPPIAVPAKPPKLKEDGKAPKKEPVRRLTDDLSRAAEIQFVPKVYTTTYTPIMMQAQHAAVKYFGWPKTMPFEDFLDTVIALWFEEHGIKLGSYVVDESLVPFRDNGNGNDNLEESEDGGE